MVRRFLTAAAVLVFIAPAQQREPKFEIYARTGAYYHGNISAVNEWRPQFGAGFLAPLGRKWGALADVSTSAVEVRNPAPQIDFIKERRISLIPSIVRLWRRDRFSLYAGAGLGFEHERQRNSTLVLPGIPPGVFQEREFTRTDAMLVLRAGTLVSLTQSVVLRGGISVLPRYADERPSASLEAGVGYRF